MDKKGDDASWDDFKPRHRHPNILPLMIFDLLSPVTWTDESEQARKKLYYG